MSEQMIAVYNTTDRDNLTGHINERLSTGDIVVQNGHKYIVTGTYRKTYRYAPNGAETYVHLVPYHQETEHIDVPAALTKDEILDFLKTELASIDVMEPDEDDDENDLTLQIKKDLWRAELRAVRAGLLELLTTKSKEGHEIMYQDTPDHPVIQNCERTGHPDGKTPVELLCPICEEPCDDVYENQAGDIVGCDQCLTAKPIADALGGD